MPADEICTYNRDAVIDGKLPRFSHMRPGTGKRGRPGLDQISGLPTGDVLFVDELTGIAYQGRATLSRAEVQEHVTSSMFVAVDWANMTALPVVEIFEEDLEAIAAVG